MGGLHRSLRVRAGLAHLGTLKVRVQGQPDDDQAKSTSGTWQCHSQGWEWGPWTYLLQKAS